MKKVYCSFENIPSVMFLLNPTETVSVSLCQLNGVGTEFWSIDCEEKVADRLLTIKGPASGENVAVDDFEKIIFV